MPTGKSKIPIWDQHHHPPLQSPHTDTGAQSVPTARIGIDTCFDNWLFMCLYAHQHKDGFISRQIHEETGLDRFSRYNPSGTGPDVMPWCEWEYYLNFGKKDRLEKVFPVLMAFHRWMAEYHTWPDGTYFSTGWGCGMDNSPRVMPGYSEEFSHGHMIWVDACMQELNNCNILMEMAKILNRKEFIEELKSERDLLEKVINEKLWNEETGFYYDLWKNGKHNMVRHIGAFWALLAKCASQEQAERLISYLEDENQFKTAHRVPSLAKSHEKYDKRGNYWLGSVWAPTNYMVLRGLDQYGKYELSHQIAMENLYAVVEVFKEKGTLFENYAPEYVNDGKPARSSASRADFVGWSGLFPITVLFEFVFGIKPDATNNKITWHVNVTEKHGVWGGKGHKQSMCILPRSLY